MRPKLSLQLLNREVVGELRQVLDVKRELFGLKKLVFVLVALNLHVVLEEPDDQDEVKYDQNVHHHNDNAGGVSRDAARTC